VSVMPTAMIGSNKFEFLDNVVNLIVQ